MELGGAWGRKSWAPAVWLRAVTKQGAGDWKATGPGAAETGLTFPFCPATLSGQPPARGRAWGAAVSGLAVLMLKSELGR